MRCPIRAATERHQYQTPSVKLGIQHCLDWLSPLQMSIDHSRNFLRIDPVIPSLLRQDHNHRTIATLPQTAAFADLNFG